jgi:hypothetical protein
VPQANRICIMSRAGLLAGIAAIALSYPAYAWGGDDAPPAPAPSPTPPSVTMAPTGGQGGHARSTATSDRERRQIYF